MLGKDNFGVLKRELGKQKSFWGGLNSDVTLGLGNEEQISNAVHSAIRSLSPGGGFVLWPVWAVDHQVPWAQVEILVGAWRRYREE